MVAHTLVQIPTQKNYHSLNLAAAVQIVAYELLLASSGHEDFEVLRFEGAYASVPELEWLYQQIEKLSEMTGFLDPKRPGQLMERFRRMMNRAELDHVEVNIWRGFLKALASKLGKIEI